MANVLYALLFVGVILLVPTAYAGKIGAPWAPTRKRAIERVFKDLGIGTGDVVVDLGAGDGKVLAVAARSGAKAVGYELSPIMWFFAKLLTLGNTKISVRFANFYRQQLPEDATVIFTFLMPGNMPRLKSFLHNQHLPNLQYVVSYAFQFQDEQPLAVIREDQCAPMYVYGADQSTSNT